VTSYVIIRALLTTPVDPSAIFPAVVVVKAPVGISVIWPPPREIGEGGVIVSIAAVPLMNTICVVGAIVAALAIVGAAAPVAFKPALITAPEKV
jgi:hypothetical protein